VIGLGRVDIVLPDELETQFREIVFKRKGLRKGNLTEALKEAVVLWIKSDGGTRN
jgi:hypothetical protein